MYAIEFTPEANEDLSRFRRFEQKLILDEIENQLQFEQNVETRNRKAMRPNPVAGWELRIGKFRVFYNVEQSPAVVSIEAIGFKIGGVLYIRGEKRTI